jgi:hypothetical protein
MPQVRRPDTVRAEGADRPRPAWSLARRRRFTVGAVIASTVAVVLLQGLAGMDVPPSTAARLATTLAMGALAVGVVTIVVSALPGVRHVDRARVLVPGAALALLAVPMWIAIARCG